LYQDEDYDPGIKKVARQMTMLPDGAHYEGEWNQENNMRHGRGY
jgi:hypothetical protein